MPENRGRTVYTTGPTGAASPPAPVRPALPTLAPGEHDVRVRTEKSGRRGHTVTVARPLFLSNDAADALLARLKKRAGTGGKVRPAQPPDTAAGLTLEIQGDHGPLLVAELTRLGYPARPG